MHIGPASDIISNITIIITLQDEIKLTVYGHHGHIHTPKSSQWHTMYRLKSAGRALFSITLNLCGKHIHQPQPYHCNCNTSHKAQTYTYTNPTIYGFVMLGPPFIVHYIYHQVSEWTETTTYLQSMWYQYM